jgi:hypothetical protein
LADQKTANVGLVPVPDPTVLTTAALLREIASLREILEQRLNGIDARNAQFHEAFKIMEYAKRTLVEADNTYQEKFRSIDIQFAERDKRLEQTSRDSKTAVDAALQAAKEAVEKQNQSSALAIAKSETSTLKQIDSIGTQMADMRRALDDKSEDLKERLTRLEAIAVGGKGLKDEGRANLSIVISVAGLVLIAAIAIASHFWK